MSWRIPLVNVELSDDDIEAYLGRLRSGWLTMGPYTETFESDLRAFTGAEHVACVSSGTAGLHLALRAAGVGEGDEVIVPAMTFLASANAARYVGAEPVFCDSAGPLAPELDLNDVERCITSRTKAVIAVHFMGYAAPVEELRTLCDARGLLLVEDASQAMGAEVGDPQRQVGTVGDIGVLSFNSKAQLPLGEGGAVLCRDAGIDSRVRSLRSHGMTTGTWDRHRGHHAGYDIVDIGFNYRLDEPRASLGACRLARLSDEIEGRRESSRAYRGALAGWSGIGLLRSSDADDRSSPYGFTVILEDGARRGAARTHLANAGIETTRYPILTSLSAFAGITKRLPRAEAFADRHCVLPLRARMSEESIALVAESLAEVL